MGLLGAMALTLGLSVPGPARAAAPTADDAGNTGMSAMQPKVVNGRVIADPGNYGLVQVINITHDGSIFRCGGAALTRNWVVTSGHCLTANTSIVQIYGNPVDASRRKNGADVQQVRYVPQNPADPVGSDLALLNVSHLPNGVTTVPIAEFGEPIEKRLVGVGFGRHARNQADNSWMRTASIAAIAIDMPLQPRSQCMGGQQGTATVCAGIPWQPDVTSPHDDFCTGDSGSPIGTLVNGRFAVVGIESRSAIQHVNPSWFDTSPNERCGFAPTIATSLRHHLPFIRQVVGSELQTTPLPAADNPQSNFLSAYPGRGGIDLRTTGTGGRPDQGVRVALQIARARYTRNPGLGAHVLLSSSASFADSLSGAPLQRNALLLFSHKDRLPPSVATQLQQMGTRRVTVLGGPAVITEPVLNQLRAMGIQVERIAGPERLSTAAAIAQRFNSNHRSGSGAYLVRAFGDGSAGFADSLAAGAAAARRNWPVLLTGSDRLSGPTTGVMNRRPEVTIVGGPAAISNAVRLEVAGFVPKVNQAQGADRTKTAELLATPASHNASVIVLDGFDPGAWHGGFAASGLAADIDAPIFLTNPATNGADIAAQLDGMAPANDASFVCIADKGLCDRLYHLWLN